MVAQEEKPRSAKRFIEAPAVLPQPVMNNQATA
jgi:hypothetical protein